ncbi:type VI secretion system-associated FHA domain protein TagH, partial [Rubrivivax gelatinosus]|nr:type VI secretion system-associated FHA domain protein TagH [Rubrivivax gelatinosus]
APTPGPAAAPAEPRALDPDLAWQAFCEGAGIVPGPPSDDPLARMQRLGRIVRSAVDGTLQLIAVRASTKHELRAGVTVIRQRDNNPLKFSPDGKTGLEQLVQPPVRGFLDGPAAMDNAMHDLVGHSIGTVAGMRAAVAGMLQRFEPAALEAKLTPGSMLESLLPMNRKARLWDLYLQHHDSIRDEAEEDFHTLFGKAFLAAYEQQIERLEHPAGPRT